MFVYRDNTPILMDEKSLYWNEKGEVITKDLKVIDQKAVFKVDGKVPKKHVAVRLDIYG